MKSEGVCRMQIQAIDNDSFFWLCRVLPHILPRIKIRVNVSVSLLPLDFIEGGGSRLGRACVSEGRYFDWLAGLKVNVSVLH